MGSLCEGVRMLVGYGFIVSKLLLVSQQSYLLSKSNRFATLRPSKCSPTWAPKNVTNPIRDLLMTGISTRKYSVLLSLSIFYNTI